MSLKVAIRADASVQMGSGHVMRCLTLANELAERGAEIAFISRGHPGNLFALIEASGHRLLRLPEPTAVADARLAHAAWLGATQIEDAQQTATALRQFTDPDWLIVDHYAIDAEWEAMLRPLVGSIMVIDDLADRRHDCDLLLDQNLQDQTGQTRYDALLPAKAIKLIGPKYALLRPEFKSLRATARARSGAIKRVLVFFGGGDPSNETGKALLALKGLACVDLAVDVVVGGANPHYPQLLELSEQLPACTLYRQVSNMAELMANADLSVGAGGCAMWERSCLGLPSIVISLAANQQPGCEAMAKQGAILYLGQSERVAAELIASALSVARNASDFIEGISQRCSDICDGRGTDRVVSYLIEPGLTLRPAESRDCEPIHRWRNAESTRRYSLDSHSIDFDQHRSWFNRVVSDPDRRLLIGEIDGEAAGVLRFDRDDVRATISVYLVPDHYGRGIGARLIEAGCSWVAHNWPEVGTIEAVIMADNLPSVSAFSKAGFRSKSLTYEKKIRN